jgi:predicted nucleic acid-binding protein
MTLHLVIDASVALKWVLDDEEAVEQAVALRDHAIQQGIALVVPSLWLYEVVNGLVTAVRRTRLSAAEAEKALMFLMQLDVRFADPPHMDIFARAIRHEIAAYDSAYLALAVALDAPFWTGDWPFFARVHPSTGDVYWIGDYRA